MLDTDLQGFRLQHRKRTMLYSLHACTAARASRRTPSVWMILANVQPAGTCLFTSKHLSHQAGSALKTSRSPGTFRGHARLRSACSPAMHG